MLEIVALYFLTSYIGKLALQKGLKPLTWKINTILAWIAGEFVGIIIALQFFDIKELLKISLIALPFAFGGFHFIKYTLEKKPDTHSTDIDQQIN